MTRRDLLLGALASAAADSSLVHEHILVDFAGAGHDPAEVFRVALPKLKEVQALGCRRFLDCTPNFLGRDATLLRRLADACGTEIWTNTGLYGALNHKYLPPYAMTETAEQLAKRWIAEFRSDVRPRFIKIGVNDAPLNPVDRKLVEAAALTSRETGLTIASHTGGRGPAAEEQLEILGQRKCPLAKFVWVHAQNEKDHAYHLRVGQAGAWVEFDGISEKSAAWHLECVRWMEGKQLLGRTLISQDAGWYHAGEPGGGNYRGYTYLYTDFLPQLAATTAQALMAANPVSAFGRG